jgi:hypothetical protein
MSAGGTNVKRRGRPPRLDVSRPTPAFWESEAVSRQLQNILDALEVPLIDAQARRMLQRLLHRHDKFLGGDGRGHVTLLIRTILESEGNQDALIEPIVSAVSLCMRPEWTNKGLAWIEAFDSVPLVAILQTMRGLDLFSEQSLGHYYAIAIRNKLAAILEPEVSKPAPVRAKRKPRTARPKRRPADQLARMAA